MTESQRRLLAAATDEEMNAAQETIAHAIKAAVAAAEDPNLMPGEFCYRNHRVRYLMLAAACVAAVRERRRTNEGGE